MSGFTTSSRDSCGDVTYCSYIPYDINVTTPGVLRVTYADTHTTEYEVTYYSVSKDMVLLVLTSGATMYINASQWVEVTFTPKNNNNNNKEEQ